MASPQLKVLYPPSIRPVELEAVRRAAERFRKFDVAYDVRELDRSAVRDVRAGNRLHDALTASPGAVCLAHGAFHISLGEVFFPRNVLALGMTPHPIFEDDQQSSPFLGLSQFGGGAIVSVHRARTLDPATADPFLELAAAHELGHVFSSRTGCHCSDPGCLMQANENTADFIARFVRPRLDFCRACEDGIAGGVRRLREEYS